MKPERSKPLHNFSLPCLKWGSQKFLKCVNFNTTQQNHHPQPSSLDPRSSSRLKSKSQQPHIKKIQSFPTKKLKVSILEEAATANAKPWNLRTRRAACKAPQFEVPHEEKFKFCDVGVASSPLKEKIQKKETEKAEFNVSLSKEEVERDFLALVGTKPPRRPKKRPKIVQRQLDTLFPGLWLTEVTEELYKVPDVPE
ncbi:hypothetical protein RIF29_06541 [Crotalaria pallida]|uniref:DUF1639 family protein n=1 Tax=Crotalaria pallida TaxID=3830 RepID=A0AAN9J5Y8_CROPI